MRALDIAPKVAEVKKKLLSKKEEGGLRDEPFFPQNYRAIGLALGTGWKGGGDKVFVPDEGGVITYEELEIPGWQYQVPGHEKKLERGTVEGKPAIRLSRIHGNEGNAGELRFSMRIIIESLLGVLKGLVVTNAAGTLHVPITHSHSTVRSAVSNIIATAGRNIVKAHVLRGKRKPLPLEELERVIGNHIRTAISNAAAWHFRGRRREKLGVGEIGVVDDYNSSGLATYGPMVAPEFFDFYGGGKSIHAHGDIYQRFARKVVAEVQGHCPRLLAKPYVGPHFEGLADEIMAKTFGIDAEGMVGLTQEVFVAIFHELPVVPLVLATDPAFVVSSHEANTEEGARHDEKAGRIITGLVTRWPEKPAA